MQTPAMRLLKVLNAVLIRKLIGKLMARADERYNIYRSTSRHAPNSRVSSPESFGLLINRDLIKPNRKETRDTDVQECLGANLLFSSAAQQVGVRAGLRRVCVRFVCEPESHWVLWHCETSRKPQSAETRLRRRLAE